LKEATAKRMEKFNWQRRDNLWKLDKFKEISFKVESRRPRVGSIK